MHIRAIATVLWIGLLSSLFLPGTAVARDVDLVVYNESAVAQDGAPLTFGVPFAQGELTSLDQIQVTGPSGIVGPVQASATMTWADGTIRWVLLDFPVELPIRGSEVYTVHTTGGSPSSSPLQVTEENGQFVVETGTLRFTVGKSDFRVVNSAFLDSDGNGDYETELVDAAVTRGLVVTDSGGVERTAGAPESIIVAENGPQRIRIEAQGHVDGYQYLRYRISINAFANSSDLRFQLTLHNENSGGVSYRSAGALYFEDARIEIATTLAQAAARVGAQLGEAPVSTNLATGSHLYLHQDSSGLYTWDKWASRKNISYRGFRAYAGPDGAEQELGSGDHAEGWIELSQGPLVAAMGISEFWQQFPNALEAQGNGRIAASVFPSFQSGDHSLRAGEQKTHVVHLSFAADGGAGTRDRVRGRMQELFALASPDYYAQTHCFRNFLPKHLADQVPEFANYELMQQSTLYGGVGYYGSRAWAGLQGNRDDDDVYGWWDYGDVGGRNVEHEGDRMNCENDLCYSMALQMARSGNPDWWKYHSSAARHLSDIDVYHTQLDALGWRNGSFFTHDRTGSGAHRYEFSNPEHYNGRGIFTYYYLTGDPVVRDAALEIADNCKYRIDSPGGYSYVGSDGAMRAGAWLIDILIEAWKLTKDQGYLDTLEDAVDRTDANNRCWIDGPNLCAEGEFQPDNFTKAFPWQCGILVYSLVDFADEYEFAFGQEHPTVISSIQRYANWINDNAFIPEWPAFGDSWDRYTGETWIGVPGSSVNSIRSVEAIASAYRLTQDPRLLTHLNAVWDFCTEFPIEGGVTFMSIKDSATSARHGGEYMKLFYAGLIDPPTCVQVLDSSPGDGNDWQAGQPFSVIFSGTMNTASVLSRIRVEVDGTEVTHQASFSSGDFVLGITVDTTVNNGQSVSVIIDGGAQDLGGNVLDGNGDGVCGDPFTMTVIAVGNAVPDQVPPAAVEDLGLSFDAADGSASLTWTAPADEGPLGMPSEVEIRYTTNDPAQSFDWATATVLQDAPTPENPGTIQRVDLGPIDASSGALRVAVRTRDAAGNTSVVSNVAADGTGPAVFHQGSGTVRVEAGTQASIQIIVSDALSGKAMVESARVATDAQEMWQGALVELDTPSGAKPDLGVGIYTIDASGWSEGESHRVFIQGLDKAANWTETPVRVDIEVTAAAPNPDCMGLMQSEPASGSSIQSFNGILMRFDQDIDGSSFVGSAFELVFTPEVGGGARSYPVSVVPISAREVRLTIGQTVSEPGEFVLSMNANLLSQSGASLGQGESCDPLPDLQFLLRPDISPLGCLQVAQVAPAVETSVSSLSAIVLDFDSPVLQSSVDYQTLQLERRDGKNPDPSIELLWESDQRLRVVLAEAIAEPAELWLHLSPQILSQSGASLGTGEDCVALQPLRFYVRQGSDGLGDGSDLGSIAGTAGLMAIDGYQVVFSDLEPGSTLSIFDTSGHLMFQQPVDNPTYSLDTRVLGSFPTKQLIVTYRGKRQFILVGNAVQFYRSYIGDIE